MQIDASIAALVVALLSLAGVVVKLAVNARKRGADTESATAAAAQAIATAAQTVVAPLQAQCAATEQRLADHIDADRRQKEARAATYLAHSQWDQQVTDQLRAAGIDVMDPPPLHEDGQP